MEGDYLTLVNYYDRSFDQALTSQYSLSIRIDPDGFSFSVYSHLANRYIGIESVSIIKPALLLPGDDADAFYSEKLSRFIMERTWMLNSFRQTCVIFNSLNYTLVPHALYDPAQKSAYLDFVHKHYEPGVIHEHFINSVEAWIVFSINRNIQESLFRHIKPARIMHHAGAIIETILPRYRHNELHNPVFVNIRQNSFDIIVLKDGKLRYCNSFSWKVNEDLVYYLIFVLDQLALNPENVPVFLLGSVEPASPLYELLHRYIRHVEFISNPVVAKTGLSIPQSSEYNFYDLLNPGLCE
ncbi:MAG: DUF3822 family protein [Lentimicrobium sp.]|nr:DUF3822 family protein [Lentimicrobium sp.]